MLTALFLVQVPPGTKHTSRLKGGYIPSLLCDIVLAGTDAVEALELFSRLLQEETAPSTSLGYMTFDAHVGDTACQLRACMLMSLRQHLLQTDSGERFQNHVSHVTDELRSLVTRARTMCRVLTAERFRFKNVGLHPTGISRCGLLEKLGWKEPGLEGQTKFVGAENEWNPDNLLQVTRLLIYCHVLSKYKRFQRRQHIIGAELDFSLPIQRAAQLMGSDYNLNNKDFWHWTQPKRVEHDFTCMQIWISQMSCAWLKSLTQTEDSSNTLGRLMETTIRSSRKGLEAVPSYVGFLAIRQQWAQAPPPILLVVRRFCSSSEPSIQWELQHVTAAELMSSGSAEPRLIICGNSIEGTLQDYLLASSIATRHREDHCPDNKNHCSRILSADHDQLAFATFATHKHYAYALQNGEEAEGADAIVSRILEQFEPGLSQKLQYSRDIASDLGTCHSLKTFMWQHIFLETEGRLAYHMEEHESSLPLSAPLKI
ncbi:hypothetical protein N7457_002463 [Penicillium paradoxum]|uniref:uncharacterized protein n=1 Tax=Penicillium paradoxum TaxID=176176 RepID=UPI002548B3D8|nr:uncharacterized protein N7457_002463 [Penicillium paradoxum]KAJ5787473.1 hypothetical protein N7457_002463 [Penicillium paradoxum]